jgi:uncharacterized membrane protein YeaQ/YmgE (transglycosylase-associated protein family)
MFDRINTSFALAKSSWAVLKDHKQLILFPVLSGIGCLFVMASFMAPLITLFINGHIPMDEGQPPWWTYAVAFIYYFCNYFVIVFCNAALIHCALMRFDGKDPTLMDGISAAIRCLPQILAWALVSATVGVILKMIENTHEKAGAIMSAILGTAWTVITYFVVPVLVVERIGPIAAIGRSLKVLKKTWGETVIGNMGLGLFNTILMLPGWMMMVAGMIIGGATGIWFLGLAIVGLALLYLLTAAAVGAALNTIYLSALYEFASYGNAPRGFRKRELRGAFKAKE